MRAALVFFLACLLSATTVTSRVVPRVPGKDVDLQTDQVYKDMVRAAKIKVQLQRVQDSVTELAQMYQMPVKDARLQKDPEQRCFDVHKPDGSRMRVCKWKDQMPDARCQRDGRGGYVCKW